MTMTPNTALEPTASSAPQFSLRFQAHGCLLWPRLSFWSLGHYVPLEQPLAFWLITFVIPSC